MAGAFPTHTGELPAVGDGREEALSGGGLDLIIFPGMGFTKVS